MSEAKVLVKWGKEKFPDVSVATSGAEGSLAAFKQALFELTNIPVDKQKVMIKGKILKVDGDLSVLKAGAKVLLMGTASELPPPPKEKIKFVEDMTKAEKALLMPDVFDSCGLNNLGNTCYMNSTLQSLRAVPELKTALISHSKTATSSGDSASLSNSLTQALGRLYEDMDRTTDATTPFTFTQVMRALHPQFAERDEKQRYKQQDADEALTTFLSAFKQNLVKPDGSNVVQSLFEGKYEVTMKNTESEAEPSVVSFETFDRMRCFIDLDVNYLFQGINKSLVTSMEKNSPVLGRNAVYSKTFRITELPRYLVVNFVRFNWKSTAQVKAKSLRCVKFTEELDASPFCESKLAAQLRAARMKLKDEKDKVLGLGKFAASEKNANKKAKLDTAAVAAEGKADEDGAEMEVEEVAVPDDLLTSGKYRLVSVVTHQGRTADAGHYIGWARQKGENWLKFDDEKVSPCKTDDIMKLSGGGDWHMSYINIYERVDDLANKVWTV